MVLDTCVHQMLETYEGSSLSLREKLREILQKCALLGLHRQHFFEHAAFYGGTALRILYGLDRFSEDLDFSLLKHEDNFSLELFIGGLERELSALGFSVDITEKQKKNPTPVLSAFVKANTYILVLEITQKQPERIHRDEKLKIKFEIDTDPPYPCSTETKALTTPIPFHVTTFSLPDLFAGKMHAILCRGRTINIKGRDWYDLIWFLGRNVPLPHKHLEARLQQSDKLKTGRLTPENLQDLLRERIDSIDWEVATQDVTPFIDDKRRVESWSKEFFLDLIPQIKLI